MTEVIKSFENRVLPLTLEILTDWLALARQVQKRGASRNAPDLLIASTARVHHLVLVSRNVKDFAGTGVVLYDPWTGKTHQMDAS
jgi:predicted nucleic acid-binding protein